MGRVIGIDLGTTNSVAAYWKRRGPKPIRGHFDSPITPSVVAVEASRKIVGRDALDRRGSGSRNVIYSAKRFIGRNYEDEQVQQALKQVGYETRQSQTGEVELLLDGKYYSPVEISAMVLEQIKKDAELVLGDDVTHAVITVPAYFSQRQKNATREAGYLAGLKVLRIITEPTAAALSFGFEEVDDEPQHILVYDLGGGTFDISILLVAAGNFDVLHHAGDNFLGGDDFDQRLVEKMFAAIRQKYGEDFSDDPQVTNRLKQLAEEAKIALSREEEYLVTKGSALTTTRTGEPVNLEMRITRAEFERLIADMVERSIQITKQALSDADMEVEDIDRVLLVGGSTRVPLVRQNLKTLFNDAIEIDVDPMFCVAMGAAIQSTLPIDWLCEHCRTTNEGTDDVCTNCGQPKETGDEEALPHVVCDECGKSNRQGKRECWSCGSPLGAVSLDDNALRITDITSKYIGVRTKDSGSPFATVIEKGTIYPTDEPFKRILYTNRNGQEVYMLPIYETENESLPREKWEEIAIIRNDKLPPGLPKDTPIMVEMRIDGDGVLTVWSYVKRMEDETIINGHFDFSGTTVETEGANDGITHKLKFYMELFNIILDRPFLNKYLESYQKNQISSFAQEAETALSGNNGKGTKKFVKQGEQLKDDLPVPVLDLFWAHFVIINDHISYTERNQMEQIATRMEQAIDRQDIDTANQYLDELRETTDKLFEKIPGSLLKQGRG